MRGAIGGGTGFNASGLGLPVQDSCLWAGKHGAYTKNPLSWIFKGSSPECLRLLLREAPWAPSELPQHLSVNLMPWLRTLYSLYMLPPGRLPDSEKGLSPPLRARCTIDRDRGTRQRKLSALHV